MRSDIHYQKEPKMLQEIVYAAQVKMKAVISITINKKNHNKTCMHTQPSHHLKLKGRRWGGG